MVLSARIGSTPTLSQQLYSAHDVLKLYPKLREDHLRYLRKWKLIGPAASSKGEPAFGFADLLVIKQAHTELEGGVPFRAVVRALVSSREGQLSFDFRIDARPAKILELKRPDQGRPRLPGFEESVGQDLSSAPPGAAERQFELGSSLDDGDSLKQERAAAAYRAALALDPYMVAALVNLANIHYSRDEMVEALALYERAIALDRDFFEAHFNLANIHHDVGRYEEAVDSYTKALRLNPAYADAHFYLAVTLEKMGRSQDAKPHWRTYQQLAPKGEWIELAREFAE